MKKLISLVLAAVMALSLVACGSGSKDKDTDTGDKTYKVGVVQLVQHEALDAATKGFTDALKEALGDKVEVVEKNASGDSNNCGTIVNGFISDKVDLIMANATPALQAAASATSTIPILGTSVTDYATALEIADWTHNNRPRKRWYRYRALRQRRRRRCTASRRTAAEQSAFSWFCLPFYVLSPSQGQYYYSTAVKQAPVRWPPRSSCPRRRPQPIAAPAESAARQPRFLRRRCRPQLRRHSPGR